MNNIDSLLNEAEKAIEGGHFADAQNLALQAQQFLELPEVPATKVPPEYRLAYVRLLFVLSSSFVQSGDVQKALLYVETLLPLVQDLNMKPFMAKVIMQHAIIYEKLSDYPRSLSYYQQVLSLYQEQDNTVGYAIALSNMGVVYEKLSEYNIARELYLQAVEINERLENKSSLLRNYLNLGNVYRMISEFTLSLEYYYKTLALLDEVEWSAGLPGVLSNIAVIHIELLDFSRGIDFFIRALELEQQAGRNGGIARCLGNLGNTYRLMGKYPEALDYTSRSLEILRSLGWQSSIGIALSHIGMILMEIKEYHRALEALNEALVIHERIGNREGIGVIQGLIGQIFAAVDFQEYNPDKAFELLTEAMRICQEIGNKKEQQSLHKSLALLYRSAGNWQKALYHTTIHHSISTEIYSLEVKKLAQKHAHQQKLAVLKKEQEITDTILSKIFPKSIIPILKKDFTPFLQEFESVSVLVADIVGFTKLASVLPTQDLMIFLNEVFTHYDTILQHHHCERVRTVGDAYLGASGAPEPDSFHAKNIAQAALYMLAEPLPKSAIALLPVSQKQFALRIGVHCGKVVAGISEGLHTWQYDMYGNTVNTAGRLERSGKPRHIHSSREFLHTAQQQGLQFHGQIVPNETTYFLHL